MTPQSRDLREAAAGAFASRLSPRYLEEHCVIPLGLAADDTLEIAAGRKVDPTLHDELSRLFKRRLRFVSVPESEILAAIMSSRRPAASAAVTAVSNGAVEDKPQLDDLESLANQAPVVKLVNVLLLDALRLGASDVHIESDAEGVRVRYRLDGVLQEVSRMSDQYRAAVISRVKIISGLDIAERRLAQDGRARVALADREVDLRVSTLPAMHGESVVLRILDHGGHGRGLSELGMPDDALARFEQMLRRTSGMIVVTGPTGSGKTTTLYAAIGKANTSAVKIVTVEDPVEYRIGGVIQIPVNPRAGFNFDGALRSILRHDPDVIMVGEMRDRATTELAVQAALTGHLVFSTLHTTDSASAITRLVDMGIDSYLVAATVQGIVAQRLVRKLCDSCAEEYRPTALEIAAVSRHSQASDGHFRRSIGCDECAQTGYRGRTGIYELLSINDAFRTLISSRATVAELRSAARAEGMRTLSEAGWELVRSGQTTIAELTRVINDDAN